MRSFIAEHGGMTHSFITEDFGTLGEITYSNARSVGNEIIYLSAYFYIHIIDLGFISLLS